LGYTKLFVVVVTEGAEPTDFTHGSGSPSLD
jgi:hypothetical protein